MFYQLMTDAIAVVIAKLVSLETKRSRDAKQRIDTEVSPNASALRCLGTEIEGAVAMCGTDITMATERGAWCSVLAWHVVLPGDADRGERARICEGALADAGAAGQDKASRSDHHQ
eukprot:370774-Rhodomonas_salina.1